MRPRRRHVLCSVGRRKALTPACALIMCRGRRSSQCGFGVVCCVGAGSTGAAGRAEATCERGEGEAADALDCGRHRRVRGFVLSRCSSPIPCVLCISLVVLCLWTSVRACVDGPLCLLVFMALWHGVHHQLGIAHTGHCQRLYNALQRLKQQHL